MFERFRRRKNEPVGPIGDDWIVVPFRMAEAARLSVYTIGCSSEIPENVRWWIAEWLASFNAQVSAYMEFTYGPEIFHHIRRITEDVKPDDFEKETYHGQSWELWENQFRDIGGEI